MQLLSCKELYDLKKKKMVYKLEHKKYLIEFGYDHNKNNNGIKN